MIRISFIIPAYNAASYIGRCIDSIYQLPLQETDFEIIVIDDCSTDDTIQIVEEYMSSKAENHNFHLLRQPVNQRQGAARNRGLQIVKGKYVIFVDSDDEVSSGIVAALFQADQYHLEMVAFHSQKVLFNGDRVDHTILPYEETLVFSGQDFVIEHPYWGTAPWGYVFLTEFIRLTNYPFAEGVLFEDSDFVNTHLYACKRMGYCKQLGYIFKENPHSTTHTMSYKHVSDYYLLGTRMLKLYDRIENKQTQYAETIREGGSYNIWKSFRRLILLPLRDRISFYSRIDELSNRKQYDHMMEPAYCWTIWTKIGIRHKYTMLCLSTFGYFALRIYKLIKKS